MKNIAKSLAFTAIAATGAEAHERARVAPPAVYDVAPGLGHFTDDVLFGEVWERPELSPRDRSLVTLAALISTGKVAQIGVHASRALDNGVEPAEIGELITQLAIYSGWPNAISAVAKVKIVFDDRGIDPVEQSDEPRIELERGAEAARRAIVDGTVAPTAPALAEMTNRVLFGDLWQRPDLSARDRSLVTMTALIAIGQPEQLPFHANRAMDNGMSSVEAAEVPAHVAFYAGWPRAMSAVPVLKEVFMSRETAPEAETDIRIVRRDPEAGNSGPADYFTGAVRVHGNYQTQLPARVSGATVEFEAGARTAWHTHPLGQTLHVISGLGWVQQEGGPIVEMRPGDLVWIPPHVRHWHGASPEEAMSHLAIAEALNGSVVTWMEKVTDAEYLGVATD
ncbi:(R)-mandelonitrile lyase [Falsirhodobacter xinxiangensis]|uniref:(R)-mandelonitrile lyase n=1 Tax=Falsirhodobacter xinxiangensis TaxID=2530049 RepID=UPI0010AA586C